MDVAQFDFDLPEDLIALRPASPRDAARLLVVHADGSLEHALVRDLPRFLRPRDALVFNDTKVIPARLKGRRLPREESAPSAKIEITLHKRVAPDSFLAFAKPARRLAAGDRLTLGNAIDASVVSRRDAGEVEL